MDTTITLFSSIEKVLRNKLFPTNKLAILGYFIAPYDSRTSTLWDIIVLFSESDKQNKSIQELSKDRFSPSSVKDNYTPITQKQISHCLEKITQTKTPGYSDETKKNIRTLFTQAFENTGLSEYPSDC